MVDIHARNQLQRAAACVFSDFNFFNAGFWYTEALYALFASDKMDLARQQDPCPVVITSARE